MKKSKLVTCLSAAFISAMALMSCSSLIKPRSGVILTIDGVPYTAEDLFEDQKTPAAAEAKFNAVYKVAVRRHFQDGQPGHSEMEEITRNTKIKINEQKANAQSDAIKNGTSYAYEWQKILDANDVDDEAGLYNKFEYELQKEKYEDKFYEANYDKLRYRLKDDGSEDPENLPYFPGLEKDEATGFPGVKFTNYMTGKQPYHIKHILVKLDKEGDNVKAGDGISAEIGAKSAKTLCAVIENLANGMPFEDVSDLYNDDTTARENGGSLGIMSRDTSFVNDFKLGIYMYEAFIGSSTDGTEVEPKYYGELNAKKNLGLDSTDPESTDAADYADKVYNLFDPTMDQRTKIDPTTATPNGVCIGQIPYGEIEELKKYADYDFSKVEVEQRFREAGLSKDNVAAKYLPRNVIFNKYFNKHNIMVITPNKVPDLGDVGTYLNIDTETSTSSRTNKLDIYRGTFDKSDTGYAKKKGFRYIAGDPANRAKNDDKVIDNINFYDDLASGQESSTQENDDHQVLRDNNGRVILVFHSGTGDSSSNDAYQGIHFVVIERSPFITNEYDSGNPTDTNSLTNRYEYYTQYYPGQTGGDHPKYPGTEGTWKHTFVNYIENKPDLTYYKERSDTVKEELKKCVNHIDTYLYQALMKEGKITFDENNKIAVGIENNINDWISITRDSDARKKQREWDETWQTYYYSLAAQAEQRKEELVGGSTGKVHSRLTPEICVKAFVEESSLRLKALFGTGGVFHE